MDATTTAAPPRAGRREWTGMAVLALPTLLISIDVFVMLLALPHLSAALHASATEQLWIMDMYGFMVAGFMVTMGTLGDRIGRRKLLLIGAAGFGAASVLAAYSTTPVMLIVARALLGVAGATIAPSTLALISNMFRDPKQRAAAIGVWLACFMGGAVGGPLVGGVLLAHFWWGSVFLLGVPAMLLLMAVGPVLLPEYRDATAGRIDLMSIGLSLAAILPVVYGLKELARSGWRPVPVLAVLTGVLVGVWFVRRQRSLAHPLLDLRLFANRAFSGALGIMLVNTLTSGAIMLFTTEFLQLVVGLTPLRAALWMVPVVATSTVGFVLSPLAARRIRPVLLISGGMAVSVVGMLVLTRIGADAGPLPLAAGWALINLGAGPLVTLGTDIVVGAAPPERAGSAAALNETSGEFGFALGIALLGSVGTAIYRVGIAGGIPAGVPGDAARTAGESLAGATAVAARLPEPLSAVLLDNARDAFTGGLHAAAAIGAVLLALSAVIFARLTRRSRSEARTAAGNAGSGTEGTPRTQEEPVIY